MFSPKSFFDKLPDQKQWDHTIELVQDAQTFSTMVYPLAPVKQKQLDEFLNENLKSGCLYAHQSHQWHLPSSLSKEGQKPSSHPGLLEAQFNDCEEHLPPPI